jgi:hypothetical protein
MAIIPADEKVFMVDKRTNTVYGGSQALQDMQQWYTMQDVADSVQPYKVFTALLTQNGGNNIIDFAEGDDFEVGVTYIIDYVASGVSLAEFGAPNNLSGTSFICTKTGVCPDAILHYNTGAPVATVLENTIGNVWFSYIDVGSYTMTSDELFTGNKTYLYIQSFPYPDEEKGVGIYRDSSNSVAISTTQATTYSDSVLNFGASIEIRVYN